MKTKGFRVYLRDLKTLREMVPAIRGETAANYFSRVTTKFYCTYTEMQEKKK